MHKIPCRNKQPVFFTSLWLLPSDHSDTPIGKEFRHKYKRDCYINFAEIFLNVDLIKMFEKRNIYASI